MEAKDALKKATKEVLSQLGTKDVGFHLEHPENPAYGDYSTNVAMRIGGKPLENAKKMAEAIRKMQYAKRWLEKIEVAGPGFINFWLSNEVFSRELALALKEGERYGTAKIGSGKTVVVEYSSPNIAKRFGIGHLRSTIIGQALYNLYHFLGYKTISENHIGDWGTQFGALLHQVKSSKLKVKSLSLDDLERLYIEFNKAAQEKPQLWNKAREWFKKLEDGDREARRIWKACVEVSLKEFNRIYDILGVKFENMHPESFYEDKMPKIIAEAKKSGVAVLDQGAWIIRVPGVKTPLILVKSDGATTYETRDLAAIEWRIRTWKPDLIIYEVGVEQTLRFRLVFGAAKLLGYADLNQFVHVKHGLYLSPSGQRFATRRGETVRLEEVLLEAIKRAGEIIEESETSRGLALKEKDKVAQAVGIGAVKYFDLRHSPQSNIIFDWEKMFLLEGNSAPYLQYTYARTQSVLGKSRLSDVRDQKSDSQVSDESATWQSVNRYLKSGNLNSEELAILRTFYKFPEVVAEVALNFFPNLLCSFLFDLAQKYNAFYNKHRIIGNPLRLAINQVTGNILKTGLNLLGIQAPERM